MRRNTEVVKKALRDHPEKFKGRSPENLAIAFERTIMISTMDIDEMIALETLHTRYPEEFAQAVEEELEFIPEAFPVVETQAAIRCALRRLLGLEEEEDGEWIPG